MPFIVTPTPVQGRHGSLCLGVDPGLAHCGLALVAETQDGTLKVAHTELVTTFKGGSDDPGARISDDDTRRMILIQKAVVALIGTYRPTMVGIETYTPLAGKQANGAFKVATIYGLVHGLATSANRPVYAATPQDIRRGLLGTVTGTKKDIERAVLRVCPDAACALDRHKKADREHIADAIAHAIFALDRTRAARRIAQAGRKGAPPKNAAPAAWPP